MRSVERERERVRADFRTGWVHTVFFVVLLPRHALFVKVVKAQPVQLALHLLGLTIAQPPLVGKALVLLVAGVALPRTVLGNICDDDEGKHMRSFELSINGSGKTYIRCPYAQHCRLSNRSADCPREWEGGEALGVRMNGI